MINTDGDDGGVTENIMQKMRHKGPTSCQGRYIAVNDSAKSLVTKAQNSQEIFDLLMPITRELCEKSVLLGGKFVGRKKGLKLLLDKKINPSLCTRQKKIYCRRCHQPRSPPGEKKKMIEGFETLGYRLYVRNNQK